MENIAIFLPAAAHYADMKNSLTLDFPARGMDQQDVRFSGACNNLNRLIVRPQEFFDPFHPFIFFDLRTSFCSFLISPTVTYMQRKLTVSHLLSPNLAIASSESDAHFFAVLMVVVVLIVKKCISLVSLRPSKTH